MKTANIKYGSTILFLVVLLMGGCTKESELGGNVPLPEGSVRIMLTNSNNAPQEQVGTKADESKSPVNDDKASENYVKKIQVFFYDAENKLECIRQYVKDVPSDEIAWQGGSEMVVNRVANLGKPKSIYVVTNWMETLPATITIGSELSLLKDQITTLADDKLPFVPSDNTPLLMSGGIEGYVFHTEDQTVIKTAAITLHRQMVKIQIKVSFREKFFNAIKSNHTFTNAKVSAYNLPKQSYVMGRTPAVLPTDSKMHELLNQETPKAEDNTWDYTLYSYENPQTGKLQGDVVKSIYFNLNVPYDKTVGQGTESHDNYYRVYINDPTDTNNPHKTLRNNHYTVTVTLIGFGAEKPEFDAIHALTTVTPWTSVDLEQEVSGKDMTINKTSVMLDGNELDSSLIARGTTTLDESLLKGIFSDITYTGDMNFDQKQLQLGYEVATDHKSITITIQDPAKAPFTGDGSATFYIQYGAYKKKITVMYPPTNIGYFGGEPDMLKLKGDGTLYPKRLAVASIDAPGASGDGKLYYKKSDNKIDFSLNSLYYGRGMNVAAAALANRENYEAFAYCASLNKDVNGNGIIDDSEMVWYLPSQIQLVAMYVFNQGMQIPDFVFGQNYPEYVYWSATIEGVNALVLPLANGCSSFNNVSSFQDQCRVRCVRDI